MDLPNTSYDYSNRVADAIYLYAEQEAQLKISNPLMATKDKFAIELKHQHYNNIYKAFQKKPNRYEKLSLRYLKHEIAKMNASLQPTLFNKILYSRPGNTIRNFINGYNLAYARHNSTIKNVQRELIQNNNLQQLSTSMKKAGFNFEMEGPLKKMIEQDSPDFHLRYSDINSRNAHFVLHFKKIQHTDTYYFEKFDAISSPTLEALLNDDSSTLRKTFHLLDKPDFTSKEAASMVNGKSICKTIDGIDTWISIEPAIRFGESAGFSKHYFDLEKELKKLTIKGADNPNFFAKLVNALKSGSSKEVTIIIKDRPIACFLEANPTRQAVYITDKSNKPVDVRDIMNENLIRLANKVGQGPLVKLGEAIDFPQSRSRKAI
jgi:hypothetical protein